MTLLIVQLSFYGPSKYNVGMLEKMRMDFHIQIKLLASKCYIQSTQVAK